MIGIKTEGATQIVFVDTPGVHKGHQKAINKVMNRSATSALEGVDVVVFVVDQLRWTDEDEHVLRFVSQVKVPVIVAVNKIDRVEDKKQLLPHLQGLAEKLPEAEFVPISALNSTNLDRLEAALVTHIPEAPFFYPEDQVTDKSSRFMAAEILREKITRQLGNELPYQAAVEIEKFEQEKASLIRINALILVERSGQKKILIGEGGDRLKKIGQQARIDMEKLFDCKVMLTTWVKVKSGWSDDERALRSLGYTGD